MTEQNKQALTDKQIAAQDARYAIDGAITYGRMCTNKPALGHWLSEYWNIGRQLAKLGETSIWDNQTPVAAAPSASAQQAEPVAWMVTHPDLKAQPRNETIIQCKVSAENYADGGWIVRPMGFIDAAPGASPAYDTSVVKRIATQMGWTPPSLSPSALTDEQIIALADRGEHLTPSPSKYQELGHGTQYSCGAPGLLGFARALLAASPFTKQGI